MPASKLSAEFSTPTGDGKRRRRLQPALSGWKYRFGFAPLTVVEVHTAQFTFMSGCWPVINYHSWLPISFRKSTRCAVAEGSGRRRRVRTRGTAVLPFHLTLNLLPGHGQGVGVYYANISALTRRQVNEYAGPTWLLGKLRLCLAALGSDAATQCRIHLTALG